jgi:hypothetical protein
VIIDILNILKLYMPLSESPCFPDGADEDPWMATHLVSELLLLALHDELYHIWDLRQSIINNSQPAVY